MKTYTFRITQPLSAFYEARIDVEADSEEEARRKLDKTSNEDIESEAYDWEQNTDNAFGDGLIEIEGLVNIKVHI